MFSQKFVIIDIYVFVLIFFPPPRYAEMHTNTTILAIYLRYDDIFLNYTVHYNIMLVCMTLNLYFVYGRLFLDTDKWIR